MAYKAPHAYVNTPLPKRVYGAVTKLTQGRNARYRSRCAAVADLTERQLKAEGLLPGEQPEPK